MLPKLSLEPLHTLYEQKIKSEEQILNNTSKLYKKSCN